MSASPFAMGLTKRCIATAQKLRVARLISLVQKSLTDHLIIADVRELRSQGGMCLGGYSETSVTIK